MKPYFQDDSVTIYHGDCRDILPNLEPVDLVLTDPPYGINHESHGQRFVRAYKCANDDSLQVALNVLDTLVNIPQIVFYSPYNPILFDWRSVLVWVKGENFGIGGDRATCWKRDFELIGVRNNPPLEGKRDSAVLRYSAVKNVVHFCEKPVPLLRYLLRKTPSRITLDPFMGSGTTLRAAKDLGRKAIGIEIEEKYCEVAAKRMSQTVMNLEC